MFKKIDPFAVTTAPGVVDDLTEESAKWWEKLAAEERAKLTWDKHAHPLAVGYRAKMYEDTAKAMRLTAKTGIIHCVCHCEPMNKCAQRVKS